MEQRKEAAQDLAHPLNLIAVPKSWQTESSLAVHAPFHSIGIPFVHANSFKYMQI